MALPRPHVRAGRARSVLMLSDGYSHDPFGLTMLELMEANWNKSYRSVAAQAGISAGRGVSAASAGITPRAFWRSKTIRRASEYPLV